jgi:hypothetical protein
MGDLVRAPRIVREHDRQPLLAGRLDRKPIPGRDPRNDGADAFVVGSVRKMDELQIGIALVRRLEAHDAGEQPAIDLRQHHMHREVTWREAAKRFRPILAPGRGQGDLEYRTRSSIEWCRAVVSDCGERRRVDDGRRRMLREMRAQPIRGARRFQRGDECAVRLKALLPQRRDQRVDRTGVGPQ